MTGLNKEEFKAMQIMDGLKLFNIVFTEASLSCMSLHAISVFDKV